MIGTPAQCDHTFTWWSVVPPDFCPKCGIKLAVPSPPPYPNYPYSQAPWQPRAVPLLYGPFYTTIQPCTVSDTSNNFQQPEAST